MEHYLVDYMPLPIFSTARLATLLEVFVTEFALEILQD